jgi:FkbM family methyltransferase
MLNGAAVVVARGRMMLIPREEAYLYYATLIAGQYSQLAIRQGDVVLDAGANVGDFTLLAAAAVGDAGRVIAVEPNTKALRYLHENLALNNMTNVKIVQAFLGSSVQKVRSTERGTFSMVAPDGSGESLELEQTTMDDIARHNHVESFDIVKMDIEGSEVDALRGCRSLADVREFAIEVHSVGLENEVKVMLKRLGFACEYFDPTRLVAQTFLAMLTRPGELAIAEREFGGVALTAALKALRGNAPSPSLSRDSGLRILHFYRERERV